MRGKPRELIRERIEDTGRHIAFGMERFLNTLGSIASAAPLLGLLGTVVGMIQMFLGILDHGVGDVNQLAGGIGKALVCTATGMIVAVPALICHRYLRGRVTAYVIEMERDATRLLDALDAARPVRRAPSGQGRLSPPCASATTVPARSRDQPGAVDRRDPGADHLLRGHHHLRRAFHAAPQLPQASDHDAPPPQYALSVLINADGHYFVNDREVVAADGEALKRALAALADSGRDKPVLLRADARTPYQAVVTAQDVLAQLGFQRIAIATAQLKEARK
jgi:biopolymer transport protein ExbD